MAEAAAARWTQLGEHLATNPPVGACADASFTPTESRFGGNRQFIDDTCAVEALLRTHRVTRLAIAHSVPWYHVRFRMPAPTRYFALARAYTPARQWELVEELRARRPQALLRVRGYGALEVFDVPDALRVPVVDAYLRARRQGTVPTPTPLGDLFLWDEPPACPPATPPLPDAAGIALLTDAAYYEPTARLLFARGWAADVARQRPLVALEPVGEDASRVSVEYGLAHGDTAARSDTSAAAPTVWEILARLPDEVRPDGPRVLRGVAADGHAAALALDLSSARVLGGLSGSEWRDLGPAIEHAAALGRTDREAACGAGCSIGAGCRRPAS